MDFMMFWWRCISQGWGTGYAIFAGVEVAVGVILAFLELRNKKPNEDGWPKKVLKLAFVLGGAVFVVSALGVAPYLQYRRVAAEAAAERRDKTNLVEQVADLQTQLNQSKAFPPMIGKLFFSEPQKVPSRNTNMPYAIEIVVQARSDTSLAVGFVCDRPVTGNVMFTGDAPNAQMHMHKRTGTLAGHKDRSFFVRLGSPPVTPKTPVIVTLWSKEPFAVLQSMQLPE